MNNNRYDSFSNTRLKNIAKERRIRNYTSKKFTREDIIYTLTQYDIDSSINTILKDPTVTMSVPTTSVPTTSVPTMSSNIGLTINTPEIKSSVTLICPYINQIHDSIFFSDFTFDNLYRNQTEVWINNKTKAIVSPTTTIILNQLKHLECENAVIKNQLLIENTRQYGTIYINKLSDAWSLYTSIPISPTMSIKQMGLIKNIYDKLPDMYQAYFEGLNYNVIQVHEISHQFFDKRFELLKANFSENGINDNITIGFHGCYLPENIDKIIKQGFLIQTSKVEKYGKGIYFSKNVSYPIDGHYVACIDSTYSFLMGGSNVKHIFLCELLLGDCCLGTSNIMIPPEKPSGTRYNTFVDNMDSPNIFAMTDSCQVRIKYSIYFI